MKKNLFIMFGVAAIALFLGSCNNSSDNKVSNSDTVVTTTISASPTADYSGSYKVTDKNVCDLTIEIQKNGDEFTYSSGKIKGNVELIKSESEVYLKLIAMNGKSPKGDVEAKYEDQTLFIQNEGNAMNEYNHFKQCDAKFLELKKVK